MGRGAQMSGCGLRFVCFVKLLAASPEGLGRLLNLLLPRLDFCPSFFRQLG
jgi:hypothetical protein